MSFMKVGVGQCRLSDVPTDWCTVPNPLGVVGILSAFNFPVSSAVQCCDLVLICPQVAVYVSIDAALM